MKINKLIVILTFVFFIVTQVLNSQNINDISNVDNMSDEQIAVYWEKAQQKGLTLDQIEQAAKLKGVSDIQILKFKQRISSLNIVPKNDIEDISNSNTSKDNSQAEFGHIGLESKEVKKSKQFGMDFFSNPNISFTPNLNLATPETYQLGPGDELLIDIWGAAENKYNKKVGVDGAVRIENVGPVFVSGMSIKEAKAKIISYLKNIYGGINASNSSYNKVNVDISLANVRTVQVNIIGEVKVPGTYSLSALSSVLNALYASGGPTENGTFRNIKIFREGKLLNQFDVYKYLTNGSQKGNLTVRDQDVIIVNPYNNKVVVNGAVKRPGVYEIQEGETISNLVSYFGGYTSNAYKDRITIERVNGSKREIKEVSFENSNSFRLRNGDQLVVGEIVDRFENRVSIKGAVYREGNYELTKDLSVLDILKKADGVKDDAFLDRGIIYRTIDGVKQEVISFSVTDVLNNTTNIKLKREDKVFIFSTADLKEEYTVSIDGAINNPQKIPFVENMQVEDLIIISGGLKEGADTALIDISRRVNDNEIETISKSFRYTASDNLSLKNNEVFYLKPFDRVSVRYKKGYTTQKNVRINGEVNYPGSYPILNKEYKILDLLEKAGGITKYAYVKGAVLIRKSNKKDNDDKGQNDVLDNLNKKQDSIIEIKSGKQKVGINLERIIKDTYSKYNLILQEGDELIIPSAKETVEVQGEVLSPSVIRYDDAKSLKEYINNAGGFSENARKSKTYVVYANGEIKSTKRFLFFKSYPKLEPGALILVPHKTKTRNPLSVQEVIGITTSITALGVLINTLVK